MSRSSSFDNSECSPFCCSNCFSTSWILFSTSDFIVEGNTFAGHYSASVSLTSASKGLVAGNTARGGRNLATVADCSDVQVRGNTAFGLSGAVVSMTGTNSGLIVRENFPAGAMTSVVVAGPILDITNHPEGNILDRKSVV